MIKHYLLLILSILLPSCGLGRSYVDMSNSIVGRYSKEAKKKYGFDVFATGGRMCESVECVFISYSSNQKLNVAQTRELFVEIEEELIRKYNENEEIRPYLDNFPFTSNNIELSLTFFDKSYEFMSDGFVAYAVIIKGIIYYSTDSHDSTRGNPLVDLHEEPYEEALRIVREAKNSNCIR
jgi:hypothetical protein